MRLVQTPPVGSHIGNCFIQGFFMRIDYRDNFEELVDEGRSSSIDEG